MLGLAGLTLEGTQPHRVWGVVFLLFRPAHSFSPSEPGAAGGGAQQLLPPPLPHEGWGDFALA